MNQPTTQKDKTKNIVISAVNPRGPSLLLLSASCGLWLSVVLVFLLEALSIFCGMSISKHDLIAAIIGAAITTDAIKICVTLSGGGGWVILKQNGEASHE